MSQDLAEPSLGRGSRGLYTPSTPPTYGLGNPRGEAVVVVGLAVPNPWLGATSATTASTGAAAVVVVVSLEAQVGSLYSLQVFASQLVPQLCRPGGESSG